MLRTCLCATLVLVFFAGGLRAAEGTVVSFDKDKLVVKFGDKERAFTLTDKTHVHDKDGKEVKVVDRAKVLKKSVKIDVEEKDGKLVEINIKK